MKANLIQAASGDLLNPAAAVWQNAETVSIDLSPTPLAMVAERSPFLALSQDHGAITGIKAAALHNGDALALRLTWADPTKDDKLTDLNSFVDGVAVLFGLTPKAEALTMGSPRDPANAWYWKANMAEPFDILAQGFGNTERRPAMVSRLRVAASHDGANWSVIFARPLAAKGEGLVQLVPGRKARIAFAVWEGSHNERSGRKSFSGDFADLEIVK